MSAPPHRWMRRFPALLGIGVLLGALLVLLWPGSLAQLALWAGGLALALLLLLTVALVAGRLR